jgi:hypothetical protein
MKAYKILWPLSMLVFFAFVILTCVTKFHGYQWCISVSAVVIIVLSCLTFTKMLSVEKSLSARLVDFFVETRPSTSRERVRALENQEATRDRVDNLITHLSAKADSFGPVEEVPPPKDPLPDPPENRLSRVLRDNYPL